MTLEVRLKQAALKTAVTITLGGLEKAPERCARTLMELGRAAFPERVTAEEEPSALRRLLEAWPGAGRPGRVAGLCGDIFVGTERGAEPCG